MWYIHLQVSHIKFPFYCCVWWSGLSPSRGKIVLDQGSKLSLYLWHWIMFVLIGSTERGPEFKFSMLFRWADYRNFVRQLVDLLLANMSQGIPHSSTMAIQGQLKCRLCITIYKEELHWHIYGHWFRKRYCYCLHISVGFFLFFHAVCLCYFHANSCY